MTGDLGIPPQLAPTSDEPSDWPEAYFVPDRYEPNYAYPLLVLMHDEGGDELQLIESMPAISGRNHVGLGLRGLDPVVREGKVTGYSWKSLVRDDNDNDNGNGFDHPADSRTLADLIRRELRDPRSCPLNQVEDMVGAAIRRARKSLHIHSERIFLVGCGKGAAAALRFGLEHPDWFAGVIAINGWIPSGFRPLAQWRKSRELRVFMANALWNQKCPHRLAQRQAKMLHDAGFDVRFRSFLTTHALTNQMLAEIDRWLIHDCFGCDTL